MKKVEEESVFVVKTLKLTDEEGAQNIIQRKEDVRKKRAERNRMKRRQKQAQLNQVKPEKAAEQLFMDRMTIQGSIRRWMSMAKSMF